MACARPVLLLLALALPVSLACSTETTPSATVVGDDDDAAMVEPDEAGSPAACESAGGTCQSFETPCPILQQNTVLCGDSVMVCCLLADDGGGLPPPVEAGGGADTGSPPMPEAGSVEAAADTGGG
jgi:hypothetical protein